MKPEKDYLKLNKSSWNKWAESNFQSDFYQMEAFREGKNSLKSIELELLGDVRGKKILHLQCHFGQDTLSLARKGAKVTGVDLSETAIHLAHSLNAELGLDARFICCDVYGLKKVLKEKFDIVFTSYGTIGWLPDIQKWAKTLKHFMKAKGRFVFAEFHPVIWMFDDDQEKIIYPYLNDAPIIETLEGNYAAKDSAMRADFISWNHGLSEVIQALINAGLQIDDFREYNYSPFEIFKKMDEYEKGKFRLKKFGNMLPLTYRIGASKAKK